MGALIDSFEERVKEIRAYLDLLQGIETLSQTGVPRLGEDGPAVTVQQTRILYSGVYLQLYNLIESTVSKCLEAVTQDVIVSGRWMPAQLAETLKKGWVRSVARTHIDLSYDNRLINALKLCNHLITQSPVIQFKLEKGGGGNWGDRGIEALSKRIGCPLRVSQPVQRAIKQKLRDDRGALGLIVCLRNQLAHGSISFAECGQNDTATGLRDLSTTTINYMREVVITFESFIEQHLYLLPEHRPNVEAPAEA